MSVVSHPGGDEAKLGVASRRVSRCGHSIAVGTEFLGPYEIRLPANAVLQREMEPLLTRPVWRPSNKPVVRHHDFHYQAGSWEGARRMVAKIEHHKGEVFPQVGFIVTDLRPGKARLLEPTGADFDGVLGAPERFGTAGIGLPKHESAVGS